MSLLVPKDVFEHNPAHVQNIGSSSKGVQNVFKGDNNTQNVFMECQVKRGNAKGEEILKRLKTLPYRDRKDRNPDRVSGTCEWFVAHKFFQEWQKSKSSRMLWVSADPGCGKSVLAKYLVDSVLKSTESRTTCYFFFKDDFDDQRSVVSALCCILHQLFKQKRILLSDPIFEQFETEGESIFSSFIELWDALISAVENKDAGEIICILDAFDECEDHGRSQLAQALCKLYGIRRNFNLKFLLTSRPYGGIRRDFQPLHALELPIIHLRGEGDVEMEKISREIDIFINDRVQNIGAQLNLRRDEQDLLLRRLISVPNRTYLWVYLTLDLIKSDIGIDKAGIVKATSHLPNTVDEAYDRILSKSRNSEEARKILHIVVAAARPLTLREMNFALDLREYHRSYSDLDLKSEGRFHEYVRDICGLFVTINDSRIYLLHQTAKEFLVRNDPSTPPKRVPGDLKWKHSLQLQTSHRILAEICIWHLLFIDFETHPLSEKGMLSQYVDGHVFLDYSANHWTTHVLESHIQDNNPLAQSILRICDVNSKRCLTWFRIYWTSTSTDFPERFTTLMIASYFGLEIVVNHLLRMGGINLNSKDATYERSALSWAAGNGFDAVVKLLIKGTDYSLKSIVKLPFRKRAEVDSVDRYGRTPLSYAVWKGNATVVKLLLKAGAKVDLTDEIGGTPLSYAVSSRHEAIVKLLLKGRTQVDSEDKLSKALLCSAAVKGHEAVVKLLLDTGRVDVNVTDDGGWTPLMGAARGGHEAVVKLLLDTGRVDVNVKDAGGRTPLSEAARRGHEAVVKLLQSRR